VCGTHPTVTELIDYEQFCGVAPHQVAAAAAPAASSDALTSKELKAELDRGDNVVIVDVREPQEYTGPLGHIRGAMLIPLGQLARRSGELSRNRPVVAVCRSGARSAQAIVILQQAGLTDAANLSGGMLRWRADGHAVEGGSS